MATRSDYQKEYYQQNREARLAAKKERYRTDAAYRAAILARAKVQAVFRSLRNQNRTLHVEHAGKKEQVFTIREMEPMVNRDKDSLYNWRKGRKATLPPPLYHTARGRKTGLYSLSQVKFLSSFLHKIDLGQMSMTYPEMGEVLRKVWQLHFTEKSLQRAIREVLRGETSEQEKSTRKKATRQAIEKVVGRATRVIV